MAFTKALAIKNLQWIKRYGLLGIVVGIAALYFAQDITHESIHQDAVDAVVILGGSRGPRVEAAMAHIANMNMVPQVYVTGGALFYGKKDTHHMKQYAISLGAIADAIVEIDTAHSTFDDATHLKRYLKKILSPVCGSVGM